ncbi:hypothetical protein JTE90_022875 [Oedothorax gibbosus]|uniref:C-1-tetrahydrofolate synthase, cytoplasmic n=1 Tax=Oedothorax gibbosus TaxID=931172 RepID=A0AAV6UR14_9ARAC|nr:hypothetical protein JTE90_022875 [Oedothorax gibbosus]
MSSTANILSGLELAEDIRNKLQKEVKLLKEEHPEFDPVLVFVQVGSFEDSNVYVCNATEVAIKVGVSTKHSSLPRTSTESELLSEVKKLNEDSKVHGIIVLLPLDTDTPVDENLILNAVSPNKDVDGLCDANAGRLSHGELEGFFVPCTPTGCMQLIKKTGVTIKGSKAVVIGSSKTVGLPMSLLLLCHHATVVTCHSTTKDLKDEVKDADIIVAAMGQPQMVKKDWVKPGAVVIDCGFNFVKDNSSAPGWRPVGNVDTEDVKEVASWITPVPGGFGPMTCITLIKNTLDAAKKALNA